MKPNIITNNQLKELLSQSEYQFQEEPRQHIREFETFNQWAPQEVYNLFDKMTGAAGGIPPTLKEYLHTGVQKTRNHWYKDSPVEGRLPKYTMTPNGWETTYLTWSENIEKAIRWRLSRMYQSMMSEYSALTTIHELLPEAFLFTSKDIDLVLGVDIVVVLPNHNKIIYIHVAKDSSWTEHNITEKAKKQIPVYGKNKKKYIWQRRWSNSHLLLKYDNYESERTETLNGHCLFKTEYIEHMLLDKLHSDDIDQFTQPSELSEFHNFLYDNNIVENGIRGMAINSNI